MQFTKIAFDGETVSLRWEERVAGAVDKHEWSCDEQPTPAFKASLAAFVGFVVNIIGAPLVWEEGMEIRQLTLKEEDSGARGVIVTALRKCEKANGRTLLLNTPYMAEPPEAYNGDGKGYLPNTVLELIEVAENEAALYRGGERGEQTELELEDSENTKNVNDRMAAAEVASTRKPRGKNKDVGKPSMHQTQNPEATEPPLDNDQLRQLLLSVERDVPVDAIATWIRTERVEAEVWARARQREMLDGEGTAMLLVEPKCLKKSATLPLSADNWTGPVPPKVDDNAARQVQVSAAGDHA